MISLYITELAIEIARGDLKMIEITISKLLQNFKPEATKDNERGKLEQFSRENRKQNKNKTKPANSYQSIFQIFQASILLENILT